ncbi:hypothetical protein [Thalassotalea sp. PLHSN55]|uniref:hypothetical protein n=1 Tax=Thalassotalea sp. PLHSN55 TaxID=3435888 RepID=UPI003F8442AA
MNKKLLLRFYQGQQQVNQDFVSAQNRDDEINTLLTELAALLEDYDTEATDFISELLPKIANSPYHEPIKAIEALVDAYNFDDALAKLNEIKNT